LAGVGGPCLLELGGFQGVIVFCEIDSDFIKRAYGHSLEDPEAWVGRANARLILEAREGAGSFQLQAQAEGSDRILSIGTLTLSQSGETRAANDQK
jgi:hypothetical protein